MIYQTLVEETKARPGRKVRIINLGLEPWEALDMDLQVEKVIRKRRTGSGRHIQKPAADYVSREWKEWLQTNRVELNAMPTPTFLEWLDEKMEAYGNGKLIPPDEILERELSECAHTELEAVIRTDILREQRVDELVQEAVERKKPDLASLLSETAPTLRSKLQDELNASPHDLWKIHVQKCASSLVREVTGGTGEDT